MTYEDGLYLTQNDTPRKVAFRHAHSYELTFPVEDENAWYHVVGTCDGNSMELYVNGDRVAQRPVRAPPTINPTPVTIAGGAEDADRSTACSVGAAVIHNHVLAPHEVTSRYEALRQRHH